MDLAQLMDLGQLMDPESAQGAIMAGARRKTEEERMGPIPAVSTAMIHNDHLKKRVLNAEQFS
jgi:hypothetical protein